MSKKMQIELTYGEIEMLSHWINQRIESFGHPFTTGSAHQLKRKFDKAKHIVDEYHEQQRKQWGKRTSTKEPTE